MANLEKGIAVMIVLNALFQLASFQNYMNHGLYYILAYQWLSTVMVCVVLVIYRRYKGKERKKIIFFITQWILIRMIIPLYDFEDRRSFMIEDFEIALYIVLQV